MLKHESQAESMKMIERYDQVAATGEIKEQIKHQVKNNKRDKQLKNVKMQKYTKSQERLIKNTDYDKDGRSPIV